MQSHYGHTPGQMRSGGSAAGSMSGQTTFTIYPVSNYTFGNKDAKPEKDRTVEGRLARLQQHYAREGVRRSVEAVLLVYEHNHPHVLLIQVGEKFFKLPGGRLRAGEDEVEGLKRKLTTHLGAATSTAVHWDVGECLGTFYRPNFDTIFYPYLPAHITRPKEIKKLFVVQLPEKAMLGVPRNYRLVAVPLFDLYDNMPRYGPVISAVPVVLSRFRLLMATQAPERPSKTEVKVESQGSIQPMKLEPQSSLQGSMLSPGSMQPQGSAQMQGAAGQMQGFMQAVQQQQQQQQQQAQLQMQQQAMMPPQPPQGALQQEPSHQQLLQASQQLQQQVAQQLQQQQQQQQSGYDGSMQQQSGYDGSMQQQSGYDPNMFQNQQQQPFQQGGMQFAFGT